MGFFNVQKATRLSFTPWHLIYITCTVRVFPDVFFDLLDLDGLDFPKPI